MKKNQKSSQGKSAVVYVASFFMALVIVFISTVLVAGVTLFNDRDLMSKVSDTTYFSELNNEIVARCKTVAAKSGIEYEAIEPVLTSGRIDSDFTVYFNSISSENPMGGRDTIDEKTLAEELYSSIVSYDPDITEEEKAESQIIAAKMAKEYKDSVVAENFESFIGFSDEYQKVSRYIFFILITLAIYLLCVIITVNGKDQKHRLFRRFSVVAGSSGLTVLIFSLLIKFSAVLEKITFAATQREYNLFMSFFDEFLSFMIGVGGVWVVVCIILIALWHLSVTGRSKR